MYLYSSIFGRSYASKWHGSRASFNTEALKEPSRCSDCKTYMYIRFNSQHLPKRRVRWRVVKYKEKKEKGALQKGQKAHSNFRHEKKKKEKKGRKFGKGEHVQQQMITKATNGFVWELADFVGLEVKRVSFWIRLQSFLPLVVDLPQCAKLVRAMLNRSIYS